MFRSENFAIFVILLQYFDISVIGFVIPTYCPALAPSIHFDRHDFFDRRQCIEMLRKPSVCNHTYMHMQPYLSST